MSTPLRNPIAFLLLPQFTVIALSSAIEPLRIANRYVQRKYQWRLLSLDGRPVPDHNGMLIQTDGSVDDCGPLGTLIVCSDLRPERFYSANLKRWLHALDRAGTTLGGLDTGCLILARAGLLRGCRVTMHWEVIDAVRERFPEIDLRPTLFEIDSRRLSSAGGTAVLDMMLALVALDHGDTVARRVAEHCLHERIRSGASGQRMPLAVRSGAHHPKLLKALRLLEDGEPQQPRTVAALAAELQVSQRHLLRLFRQQLAESPQRYQLRVRLERARGLLMQTDLPVTQIAQACGFQSTAHFARAYRNRFGKPPSMTRRASAAPAPLTIDRDR
ncbi:MAG TPA: GlxA family transcriptional regulator [Burkholderiaceae bacterium]|nr:GlxA family transcriptional regulator [Burkholderiaceae bacterium]